MTAKHLTLTALATTLAISVTAIPGAARDLRGTAPSERGFIYLLKTSDANKDGRITEDEFIAFQDGRFADIDVNSDSVITPGEFSDYRKAKIAEYRKDNPRAETAANKNQMPEAADDSRMAADGSSRAGNRNGWTPHMAMQDGGHHRMGPDGARQYGMRDGQRRGDMQRVFFVRTDTDRSGQISAEEFSAISAKMFARIDHNGDLVITVDDLPDRPMHW
nr:EF-hand domain-containing protein [Marinicella sp. W31]MDC2876462.1 EF-hand domain-containing protein [Marinicella sp. W31]